MHRSPSSLARRRRVQTWLAILARKASLARRCRGQAWLAAFRATRATASLGEASHASLVHVPTTSRPRPRTCLIHGQASSRAEASMASVFVADSEDDDDTCLCKRCGEVHGVKGIEECRRVRREQSRCKRCGLVHKDYDGSAWIIYGFDKFYCELYIPNVAGLQMDGDTIILPPHVQSRIDELSSLVRAKRIKKKREHVKKKTDT
ncbi:hypothetical protein EJB05_57202, partial [Eragrostis curvula]